MDRVGHAYLFSRTARDWQNHRGADPGEGPKLPAEDRGARPCNKCEHCKTANEGRFLDLIEMDAASNTGVDDVRELRGQDRFFSIAGTVQDLHH